MRTAFMIYAALITSAAHAQTPPPIQWQHRYGGSGADLGFYIRQTSDGGYIASTCTASNDGDVSGQNSFASSWWPLKFGPQGDLEWSRCYGGAEGEWGPYTIIESGDGGYLLAGTAQSNDGDVTCDLEVGAKFWIARLAPDGEVLWDICPLGPATNNQLALGPAHGSGWILCGRTFDTSAGQGCGMGGGDAWTAHMDDDGAVLWSRCYGGSETDFINEVVRTSDGGYILVGGTRSNDGDVAGMNPYPGGADTAWIIKLDSAGTILWQRVYGGSGSDRFTSVAEAPNGGFWCVGYTTSADGHVVGQHGGEDIWLVRTDPEGLLLGQRCLGGTQDERALNFALLPNDHVLIAGHTNSNDGDVAGQHGGGDGWVVELDPDLEIVWQKAIGGSGSDRFISVTTAPEGGAVLMGYSSSTDGDLEDVPHAGHWDVWIMKLAPWIDTGVEDESLEAGLLLYPNPTTGDLQLHMNGLEGPGWQLEVVDALGRVVHAVPNVHATQGCLALNTNGLAQGTYALRLHRNGESHVRRFIKQ